MLSVSGAHGGVDRQTEGRTENEIIAIITNMRTGYTKIDRKGLLNMKEK